MHLVRTLTAPGRCFRSSCGYKPHFWYYTSECRHPPILVTPACTVLFRMISGFKSLYQDARKWTFAGLKIPPKKEKRERKRMQILPNIAYAVSYKVFLEDSKTSDFCSWNNWKMIMGFCFSLNGAREYNIFHLGLKHLFNFLYFYL